MRGPGLLLAALALACSPGGEAATGVVLISIDTLRADHLGCYGYARDTSPHLDRLAAEGVVFERAVAQAASTYASHFSLFHSRLASRTRREDAPLAEQLRRLGFRTAAFTGGGNVSASLGFGAGFEVYEEDDSLGESIPAAEGWLRERAGEPFFLFLHGYDVHAPYDPPAPFDTLFASDYRGEVRGADTLDLLRRIRRLGRHRGSTEQVVLTPGDRERIVALYDGGIRHADARVGGFLDALDDLGLRDTSVVVVLSDHGEEFWEHGSVMHRHALHQEVIHVPLIWRLPGGRLAGTRVSAAVPLLDVAPTVLELVGAPPAPRFEGATLLALMEAGGSGDRPAVSELHVGEGSAALVAHPWKLIASPDGPPRLFHLGADPGERDDLHAERPRVAAALRAQLAARTELVDTPGEPPDFDPEAADAALRERLRELGYVE